MIIRAFIFFVVLAVSVFFLYKSISKILANLSLAEPYVPKSSKKDRIKNAFKVALGQSKIFRERTAGAVHAGIFWGFLMLLFSASEAIFQGFYPAFSWSFLGPFYSFITLGTDIFCVVVLIAIIVSFIRRFILKVPRLQGDSGEKKDAIIVLTMIFLIVGGLLMETAGVMALEPNTKWAVHPIAGYIGSLIPLQFTNFHYEFFWWEHIIGILFFANYLPYSKHFHVFTSIQNVYFSNVGFSNTLPRIDFEKEGLEKFGVVDINDLTWKNIYDSYSCTHCGRCQSVCPANQTGKLLSPREVIVQVRHRTHDVAPIMLKKKEALEKGFEITLTQAEQDLLNKKFVGEYEAVEALWQCTTCGACMQECPILIEHVPAIIGMRRNLVMMESDFPQEVQPAFASLENNASPWAFSPAERADWAEGRDIKTAAEDPDFDILFWVGCAGSFDDRAKKISLAFSKLMQIARVNFRILGTEEQCNGDFARRTGNEYLADMLVKANIETLDRYNVKKIVTICPHCFNTMKNEYPSFGGSYEVVHHAQFLEELINSGKLKLKKGTDARKVVYHDSCYLGRYNEIFSAPRNVLSSVSGVTVCEAERHTDRAFCCGAGGGRMFMEETVGARVNVERTRELLRTGADTIALNCPFCMTMLVDGVKDQNKEESVQVKDIAEILLENVEE